MSENDYRKQLIKDRNGAGRESSAPVSRAQKLPSNNANTAKRSEAVDGSNQNNFRQSLNGARNKMSAALNRNKGSKRNSNGRKASPRELQNLIKRYEKKHFKIMVVVAIISDILDGTWIVGAITKPLIFIFLKNCGDDARVNIKDKLRKMKILTFFDLIPLIDILPLSTISILMTWNAMHKEYTIAKKQLTSGNTRNEWGEELESEEDEYAEFV